MFALAGLTPTVALLVIIAMTTTGVLIAQIRTRPALRKIANEREANLLHERAAEMDSMRERMRALEARLAEQDRIHDAERALDRHRINNLDASLNALLMLIEQDPEKAKEAAATVRRMREEQLLREAAEKAAIHAAGIHTVTTTTTVSP
jgi:uncharacterized protein YigA (DUF484 family)